MSKYRVEIKRSAIKEIESIGSKKDRQRVVHGIGRLSEQPRPPGCKKLSGLEAYRIRIGRYRVIYTVEDGVLTVIIVRVRQRKKVYRE